VKEWKWEFDLPGKQSGMPPGSRAGGDMKMTFQTRRVPDRFDG